MMINETVGDRFAKALETKYGKMNNGIIAEKYDFAHQTIAQAKKKKAINETIALICENEEINLNWIQNGKGGMFTVSNISENYVNNQNGNGNLALNGKLALNGNSINININKDSMEIVEYFNRLPKNKQEYYSLIIRAEVLKNEMGI
jgi:hypothetical protein